MYKDDKTVVLEFIKKCSKNDLTAIRIFIEGIKARYQAQTADQKKD